MKNYGLSSYDIRNYYVIFEKTNINEGRFVCVVGDEDVAIQFCKDHPNYYYMERNKCL